MEEKNNNEFIDTENLIINDGISREISDDETKEKIPTELDTVQEKVDRSQKEKIDTLYYRIENDVYEKGFVAFQKKYVYPKNYVMTAAFVILMGVYIYQLIKNPSYQFGYIFLFLCFAFIIILWYNPYKVKKHLINSIKDIEPDDYTLDLYDDEMVLNTKINNIDETNEGVIPPETSINFEYDTIEVLEKKEFFLIYLKKKMFYLVPKEKINESQTENLRNLLKKKIDKKFFDEEIDTFKTKEKA